VRRLESPGARRIDIGQGDVGWAVLAGPEGNESCVLSSREAQLAGIGGAGRRRGSGQHPGRFGGISRGLA